MSEKAFTKIPSADSPGQKDPKSNLRKNAAIPAQGVVRKAINYTKENPKKVTFSATVLAAIVILYTINSGASVEVSVTSPFNYYVYCPQYYRGMVKISDQKNGDNLRRMLVANYKKLKSQNYDVNNTYIITIETRPKLINGVPSQNESFMYYCGLVRAWYDDCTNVKQVCTSPGPIFDVEANKPIDVVWINFLNEKKTMSDTSASCFTTNDNPHCMLGTKNIQYISKTFLDPTNLVYEQYMDESRLNYSNWAVTTHVHGLEVRPTFDGNPLSWISNSQNRGVGAFSIENSDYYKNFMGQGDAFLPPNIQFENISLQLVSKVNRYPNTQNPGNLWYHDHAMRGTLFNVKNGLAGVYIIRDKALQSANNLPVGQYQKVLLIANEETFVSGSEYTYKRHNYYRFRILNNNFGGNVNRISFKLDSCQDGKDYLQYDVMGADSSLMNSPIRIKQVILTAAERIELIIYFGDNTANKNVNLCISKASNSQTALPTNWTTVTLKLKNDVPASKTPQLNMNVPFYNLSDSIPTVKRMRPLMFGDGKMMLNGHYDFHKGASQNPRIGSIEDWYIINTISFVGHPVHIHLINFQIVKRMQLRTVSYDKTACSTYKIAFEFLAMKQYVDSGSLSNQKLISLYQQIQANRISLTEYCGFMSNLITIPTPRYPNGINYTLDLQVTLVNEAYYLINLQNKIDSTGVSGINVEELIGGDILYVNAVSNSNCPNNTQNKFICKDLPIQPYLRRWKDTAWTNPFEVSVHRIRWTKSNYTGNSDTPFHVPIDQLIQFPGFVYHCHILGHEDNQMMRPIMLQPPVGWRSTETPGAKCTGSNITNWAEKAACLNALGNSK